MEKIDKIEQQIIEDKLQKALTTLLEIFKMQKQEQLANEVLLVLGRLNRYEKNLSLGLVGMGDAERTKIRLSILNLKTTAAKLLRGSTDNNNSETDDSLILLLDEKFLDNRNNWDLESPKVNKTFPPFTSKAVFKNGRLIYERLIDNHFSSFEHLDVSIDQSRDFIIRSRINVLSFSGSDSATGIHWGGLDTLNFFQFLVTIDGRFMIRYKLDGYAVLIKEWTTTDAMDQESKIYNLEVNKKSGLYYFLINERVVYTSPFIRLFGKQTGVCLLSRIKVAVDSYLIFN